MMVEDNLSGATSGIRKYYGEVLQSNLDLQTTACCPLESLPPRIQAILKDIHPEVLQKFYGCGSPIPADLQGKVVLDLGSGSGRDSFIVSKLVGPAGKVIGIDMTPNQVATAKRHLDYHMKRFSYTRPNMEFLLGQMEDLHTLGIEDESVDIVISNCVLNLASDKRKVFAEIFRVLRAGGELYFSDVFADRRIPSALAQDQVLLGECLAGALYKEDFRRIMEENRIFDFRVVSERPISLSNPEIESKIGMVNFTSRTIRAFKLELEDRCEDYGQVAYYQGTIPECPHSFVLDDHHLFPKGRPILVCGNTAAMVSQTRLSPHFKIIGNRDTHYGLFDCGPTSRALVRTAGENAAGPCC